jgi:hypothetical protein
MNVKSAGLYVCEFASRLHRRAFKACTQISALSFRFEVFNQFAKANALWAEFRPAVGPCGEYTVIALPCTAPKNR